MHTIRTIDPDEARRLGRRSWRWLLRLTGHRTFVRTGTSGDRTYLAVRGDVRAVFVERLESLGFREERSA